MAAVLAVREARDARPDELLELVHALRKDLEARGERLAPGWTEEAVEDLRSGRLTGWWIPSEAGGLGFYSRRGARAFGHVHLLDGTEPVERAIALMDRIGRDGGLEGRALTLGVTGVGPEDEPRIVARWADGAARSAIGREGLDIALEGFGPAEGAPAPPGFERVAAERVTSEALADLDWRGFEGSLDARLFGGDREENGRMVQHLLRGGLGPVLPAASFGLLGATGRLAGFVLSVELTPQLALVADLVVDPPLRGGGLGRWLLEETLRALRGLGYRTARLWVTEGNEVARRLYETVGFRRYARAIIYLQDGVPAASQPQ